MKSYEHEPTHLSYMRVISFAVLAVSLVAIFAVLGWPSATPPHMYERISDVAFVPAYTIYICIPIDRQLQNMGLQADVRYINVPINPTIIESRLDGLMTQKTILDGRILYKVELPHEVLISSITLDMAGGGLVYIFIEDADGKRVWERYEKLSPQRYNTIKMSNLTVLH